VQATEVITSPLSVAVLDNGPHIAALAEQVKELKETVNVLIEQIQMLHSELKK
jgi:ubiquinone biosynthesis protein UbiJ